MSLVMEIVKPHLMRALLLGSLVAWASFATVVALSKKSEVVLIGIDKNGTRLIHSQDDPLFKTELVEFLRHYLLLTYQFSPESFAARVGDSTSLMSDTLWQRESENIRNLQDLVQKSGLNQTTKVLQINQLKSKEFQSLIEVEQKTRLKTQKFQLKVTLGITPRDRTRENPWGMEITEVKEERL
ncbi:MAG: hypothetical protein KDD43_08410 [Bdellovibrionales bacterium]|nr:hypothetical protein [Bdellovibrionales bacterium]